VHWAFAFAFAFGADVCLAVVGAGKGVGEAEIRLAGAAMMPAEGGYLDKNRRMMALRRLARIGAHASSNGK